MEEGSVFSRREFLSSEVGDAPAAAHAIWGLGTPFSLQQEEGTFGPRRFGEICTVPTVQVFRCEVRDASASTSQGALACSDPDKQSNSKDAWAVD